MRLPISVFFVMLFSMASAQSSSDEKQFISRLKPGAAMSQKLLSTRSVVFYTYTLKEKDLKDIQLSFQRTGIDAIAYFETDKLLAGKDVAIAFANYLNKREVVNLVFILTTETGYAAYITEFNTKETIVEHNQYVWSAEDKLLSELLKKIYRSAAGSLKNQNLLINELPETDLSINPITGNRSEFFAIDMKVDPLAVPKTGDASIDKVLEEIFQPYPFKYKLTEPGLSDRELRNQGSYYVLCYIHARGSVAKKMLGYDMSKGESALISVTYSNGQQQLKSFSANTPVYKFYFKHIDSGNVFLGTKWDADLTWEQALKNQIKGFKAELKVN